MTNEMLIRNMLTEVRDFNLKTMISAQDLYRSIGDQASEEWQMAYQIYRDSQRAYAEAARNLQYGMPGID